MAMPQFAYEKSRFHASFHLQVRFQVGGKTSKRNWGIVDVAVTAVVVNVFRGADRVACGDEVQFLLPLYEDRRAVGPGGWAMSAERFSHAEYAEVFLDGSPPYCRVVDGQMDFIDGPTAVPLLKVLTEAEILESIKEYMSHMEDPDVDEPIEVVLPLAGPFQHAFTINSLLNKSDGTTYFYLDANIHDNLLLRMARTDDRRESNVVYLFVQCQTKSWENGSFHDLMLHVDGMPVHIGHTVHSKLEGGGQAIQVRVEIEVLARVLRVRKITGQLGKFEFALTDNHLEAMRDFASRIPAGKTYCGKFVVSHSLPTGEPPGFDESARLSWDEKLERISELIKQQDSGER